MGTTAHIIGVDASDRWFDAVRARLEELEARWSRFRPSSDVCVANARAGEATTVAPETATVVATALEWSVVTGGLFDLRVLDALVGAGYDRSFELVGVGGRLGGCPVGATPVTVDLGTSTVTVGEPIDLGGIGKGAAADLVVRELGGGVAGGCINVGGDLRAWGAPPDGAAGWSVAVAEAGVTISVVEGAIATSSTERRRWTTVDGDAHHLIDPRTGRPAVSDLRAVTVVDESALAAEVLAKAALIAGTTAAGDVLRGAPALLRTDDAVFAVNGMEDYLS